MFAYDKYRFFKVLKKNHFERIRFFAIQNPESLESRIIESNGFGDDFCKDFLGFFVASNKLKKKFRQGRCGQCIYSRLFGIASTIGTYSKKALPTDQKC